VFFERRWDGGREGRSITKTCLNRVLGPVHSHAHPLLDVRRRDLITQPHDELGDLLDVDHVLGVVLPRVDDLGAAGHLRKEGREAREGGREG